MPTGLSLWHLVEEELLPVRLEALHVQPLRLAHLPARLQQIAHVVLARERCAVTLAMQRATRVEREFDRNNARLKTVKVACRKSNSAANKSADAIWSDARARVPLAADVAPP